MLLLKKWRNADQKTRDRARPKLSILRVPLTRRATRSIPSKARKRKSFEPLRLTKTQFWRLLDWLERHRLESTQYQSSALTLLMFLWLLAYGEPQRNVAHKLLCSQSTVSASCVPYAAVCSCCSYSEPSLNSSHHVSPERFT